MKAKSKEILENLIKFKTISGKNPDEFKKCFEYIDSLLLNIPNFSYREYTSNGFISRVYSHTDYIKNDVKNFDVYLYGNLDVVDGGENLFKMREVEDKLFGRGTIDMKFGVAVSIEVILNLTPELLKKPIAFVITTDEELGGINGVKYLVDEIQYRGKCIIGPNGLLDTNLFNFEIQNKGTIHTVYNSKGIPSHGSRPWLGKNAIDNIIEFYLELKARFNKGNATNWSSTINLGVINGGFATNAVADKAFIKVDFRYTEIQQAKDYYLFEESLMEKYNITKELIVDAMNISVDRENDFFKKYLSVAEGFVGEKNIQFIKSEGSHDVREFYKVGMFPIIFTPRGSDHHTDNEWIKESDLTTLVNINLRFLKVHLVPGIDHKV